MKKIPYTKIKLSNGLTLIVQSITWVHSVSVYISVCAGPRYETVQTSGTAHFLEHMLFEGTKRLTSSKEVAEYIEKIGGIGSAFTDKDYVLYFAKVPKQHAEVALDYLAEILFNSTLHKESIEKEKKIVMEELKRAKDTPEVDVWESWMEWIWGKHQSLGRSTLGNTSTIKAITGDKLKAYRNNFYIPSNMIIAVVGNLPIVQAKYITQQYFGKSSSKMTRPHFNKSVFRQKKTRIKIIKSSTLQNQLLLGLVTGISYRHQDRFPMNLLAYLLGKGVSSRLIHKLIYELGITYTAGVSSLFFSDTGLFYVSGGFSSEHIDQAIKTILTELDRLTKEKVPNKELEEAKEKHKTDIIFSREAPDSIAYSYVVQEATEKKIMTVEEMSCEIDKVSAKDIQRVAKKYFIGKNMLLMIKGPLHKSYRTSMQKLMNKYFI